MLHKRCILSRSGSFIAGLVLALAAALAPMPSAVAADSSWHEMRFILDHGVDAPYFSFRCYSGSGRGIHRWAKNKPKGIYYKCSGKGSKRPAYAVVQLKSPFFKNASPKMRPRACSGTGGKHTCVRITESRGRISAKSRCTNSC